MASFSIDRDYLIAALIDLVRIDSVNPSLVPGGAGESRIAAHVAEQLESLGLDVEILEATSGRPSVVGRLRGEPLSISGWMEWLFFLHIIIAKLMISDYSNGFLR